MESMYSACRQFVDADAQTSWSFDDPTSCYACETLWAKKKGRHMKSLQVLNVGACLLSEKPIAVQISGTHYNRVCFSCRHVGIRKACISESCKHIYFCSKDCLGKHAVFLDTYGKLVEELVACVHPDFRDHALLVIHILYMSLSDIRFDISQIYSMELGANIKDPNLFTASSVFFNACCRCNPPLLPLAGCVNQLCVENLFRAIKYNAQSLPIPSLPATQFLCIFATASKFNHSCSPNLKIVYGIRGSVLCASLVAVQPIQPGDELCISYINALNLRVSERQALLTCIFSFTCNCTRCYGELRSPLSCSIPFEGSKKELSLFRQWCVGDLINSSSPTDMASIIAILMSHSRVFSGLTTDVDTFNRSKISIYDINDMSAAILKRLKVLNAKPNAPEEDKILSVVCIVQICSVISSCWKLLGGYLSTEQLNVLMYGLATAFDSTKAYPHRAPFDEFSGLRETIREMCQLAKKIISMETKIMINQNQDGKFMSAEGSLEVLYAKMAALVQNMLEVCK